MKSGIKVITLYIAAVLVYSFWIHYFTIPVHLEVDEELYISMAKSFHYTGRFMHEGNVLNYSCVLYSMLLSLAYYFYSPETIMFKMRLIGTVVMLSSVFPIYLLGKKILNNEKKALIVSALFCILPSAANVAYCMQEVLCYPLFLWIVYMIYREMDKTKLSRITVEFWGIAILGTICYFVKTYMIFVPVVYFILVALDTIEKRDRHGILKLLLYVSVCAGIYVLGKNFITYCNQGAQGSNHYASQFSNLFPITMKTFAAAVSCSMIYLISLLFYWGILPILLPAYNYRKYSRQDRHMIVFLGVSLAVLIGEIVISIVLTEEGSVLIPHKVLYRYFQILEIPILLMFLKGLENYVMPKWIWSCYLTVLGGLTLYYFLIGKNQRTAIMDAPIFLLMENINRFVIPHFNVLVCILSVGVILGAYVLKKRRIISDYVNAFLRLSLVFVVLFWIINMFQLPYYTNIIADGKNIEKGAVELEKYYEDNRDRYETVYFVDINNHGYERALYAYFPVDIINISNKQVANEIGDKDLTVKWSEKEKRYMVVNTAFEGR